MFYVFLLQKPTTFPSIVSWNDSFELPQIPDQKPRGLCLSEAYFFLESSLDKPLSYLSHPRLQAMACK